jgi:Trk-type K+ transport system membrane component
LSFGERIPGLIVNGRELRAAVFNENEVRAAAGITMVVGAVAFSYAYFEHQYIPLQATASFFLLEFLLRVTLGIRYSPVGVLAHLLMRRQPPQWVSAKPKRFAWSIGLAIAFAMTIITNSGIRGWTPRSLCLLCLTMMWLESALGLCMGCQLYGFLARRGWITQDDEIEICADGACEVPYAKRAE